MRDRMILFRDQFDLDDCFRCLLGHSVFHGGDPAIAANWQLPPEFFEKYWFLTIDYDLRRTTNRWRRLQGLSELDFKQQKEQQQAELKRSEDVESHRTPSLEQSHRQNLNYTDISALLGIDFWKIAQQNSMLAKNTTNNNGASYASSLSSDCSFNSNSSPAEVPTSPTTVVENDPVSSFEPVRLTNGYCFPYSKPQQSASATKKSSSHRRSSSSVHRHHPYQKTNSVQPLTEAPSEMMETDTNTCDPWDTLLVDSSSTSNGDYGKIYYCLYIIRS